MLLPCTLLIFCFYFKELVDGQESSCGEALRQRQESAY